MKVKNLSIDKYHLFILTELGTGIGSIAKVVQLYSQLSQSNLDRPTTA